MRRRIIVAGAALGVGIIAAGAVAYAGGDSEGRMSGPKADRAVKAALDATGGGTANSVELDNENGATWEVEVTRGDGSTVDVRLDERYGVVVIEGDGESSDGGDATN
jgi:hypothetical protein